MKIVLYKANTPSKRHYINIIHNFLIKKPLLKTKLLKIKKISGRNNIGRITVFNRGSSHKKIYRKITNQLNFKKFIGIVFSIEYDPNRNSFIASIFNIKNKFFYYIIAANNLKLGDVIKSKNKIKLNYFIKIKYVPIGCPIFNIKMLFSKSAGTYSVLINKTKRKVILILSSNKKLIMSNNFYCFIGIVSNKFCFLKQLGKAGRSRWLGFKSKVKGIAMNPIDHPNGGGEGKKSSKRFTPWGKILKSKN